MNTLTNFRNRIVEIEALTNDGLIIAEVEALSKSIVKYLSVDNKKVRVYYLMVSSSCKKLSRIELIYSVNSRLIKSLNKINPDIVSDELNPYIEKGIKMTLYIELKI